MFVREGNKMKTEQNDTVRVLKKLASDAKYRMRHCSYQNKVENMNIKRNLAFQNHLRMISENNGGHSAAIIKIYNDYVDVQNFANRVRALLDKNEDIVNPLYALADAEVFDSLNEVQRQKYIFDLSEKYNRVREAYIREKQLVFMQK